MQLPLLGSTASYYYAADFYRTTRFAYRRDDNLQMGDIHKLITLDTPHFGSKLANALVDENGGMTELGVAVQGPLICSRLPSAH